jgi:predicted PurR-regulated permease PerM
MAKALGSLFFMLSRLFEPLTIWRLRLTLKKLFFLIVIISFILIVIYLSRAILLPFILAFFLAYALNPIVEFLEKRGARRDFAILTIYGSLFIIGVLILEILIPRLIRDLTALIQKLPLILKDLQGIQSQINRMLNHWQLPFDPQIMATDLTQRITNILKGFFLQLGRTVLKAFSQSLLYILIPLIAYYISRDYPRLKNNVLQWTQKHMGNHWMQTFLDIDTVFKYYIRSQLLDILIVGALFAIGLSILGFEAAILLGFIVGVFNLIPYFGPIIGAIPLIIFAALKSPWLVFYVIILFLAINQMEALFLAPRIISYNLRMNPVTVIFLIMFGGAVFGLMGMIFAVPLGAIVGIIIKSFYDLCFQDQNVPRSDESNSEKPDLKFSEPD